ILLAGTVRRPAYFQPVHLDVERPGGVPLGAGIFSGRREELGNKLDHDVHAAALTRGLHSDLERSASLYSPDFRWPLFCFFFARRIRSVFFRLLARFLALSLPLLFPIHLRLIQSWRFVTLSFQQESKRIEKL